MRRALLLLCLLSLAGCGGASAAPAPQPFRAKQDRFDADAAFAEIKRQVGYGQRPAGSPQLRALAASIHKRKPGWRYEQVPGWPDLRNVVAVVKGSKPALVVGAHYDTLTEPKGFVGANNGAAGSAIVMQLARELARRKRPKGAPEVRFVLFDGEEPPDGLPEDTKDFYHEGLRGSRAYVKRRKRSVGAMVLLDYVAGKGLRLPREGSSSEDLWAQVREAALAVSAGAQFPDDTGTTITDDHTPFLLAGIPAVDLIDYSYPGHSLEDGLDKLDVRSVDAVGETITRFIARWRPYAG